MSTTVSVVIPSYNYGRFIARAVESVLGQTHRPHEIIVVDDGSTDETLVVLEKFGNQLRVIVQINAGVGAARNTGASAATGELIAFLDADDEWEPTKLEKQVARFVNDPHVGMAHCGMVEVDVAGRELETMLDGVEGHIAKNMLLFEGANIVAPGSTMMVRREIFEEVGGFDVRCPPSEDWDFAFNVARRHKVAFVVEPLLRYRQHGKGGHLNIQRMERGMLIAFEKAFSRVDPELSPLKRRAYGNLRRALAGSYFRAGNTRAFLRNAVLTLAWTPEHLVYFAMYPYRWTRRKMART